MKVKNFELRGFVPVTLTDWPGKVAAMVFTGGCNFRCPFCYNTELVLTPEKLPVISQEKVFSHLKKKKNWLDGLVVGGGEPTLQKGLPEFCQQIKKLGFLIHVQTNGTNPEILEKLVKQKLVDYLAMDIKGPLERYDKIVGVRVNKQKIQKSVDLILKNPQIKSEFRTTVVPGLLSEGDIEKIGQWLGGEVPYYLQQFRNGQTIDPKMKNAAPYLKNKLEKMTEIAGRYFKKVELRGI